jgi:hypothetical protein
MNRSPSGCCQGLRGAIFTSSRSRCLTRDWKAALEIESRSLSRSRGADSQGNASTICREVYGAVGCLVILKWMMRRRS